MLAAKLPSPPWLLAMLLAVALCTVRFAAKPVRVLSIERGVLRIALGGDGISLEMTPPALIPVPDEVTMRSYLYRATIAKAAKRAFGPDAPVALLAAQVHVESAWQTAVCSGAGACGIAQFMPRTADLMASRYADLTPVNRSDPAWALTAQALHMAELHAINAPRAATPCDAWAFDLSQYNGGPKMFDAEAALAADATRWGSIAPQRVRRKSAWLENRAYVRSILARVNSYIAQGFAGVNVCASA